MTYLSFDKLTKDRGMKLLTLNAHSLKGKIGQLRRLQINCDFLCVTETWLKPNIRTNQLRLPNMTLVRNDRRRTGRLVGGGVACYIHNKHFPHASTCPELTMMTKDIETIGIVVTTPGQRQKIVITTYKPPRGNTKTAYKALLTMIQSPIIGQREIWILGDMNVNTKLRNTTKYGYLSSFLRKSKLTYLPTGNTHYHPRGASCLDHIYTNCHMVANHGLMNDAVSDHVPVFALKKQRSRGQCRKEITGRSYKNYNSIQLKAHMQEQDWSVLDDATTPDDVYDMVLGKLTDYLNTHHPIKTFSVPDEKYPVFNENAKKLIRQRRKALKESRRIRQGIYNVHTARARRLMKRINVTMAKNRCTTIIQQLDRYRKDPRQFWSILKDLWSGSETTGLITLTDDHNDKIPAHLTAEFINDFYSSIGVTLAAAFTNNAPAAFVQAAPPPDEHMTASRSTEEQVVKLLKKIDTTKSSGVRNIKSVALKDCLLSVPNITTKMYNSSIDTRMFPKCWRLGRIIPLPKAGDPSKVGNWRPVCLLNACSKVAEKILHQQLLRHLLLHNHLSTRQYGFIPGRSTTDAVYGLVMDLYNGLNKGMPSAVVFLDLRKAFDTVKHSILEMKLFNYGVSGNTLEWIQCYLRERQQCTEANGITSSQKPVPCGVPQGSVLGPLLFLVYINDVQETIENVQGYMYADDLALVSTGKDLGRLHALLQADTTRVSNWCRENELTVNSDKTKVLWVYPSNTTIDLTDLDVVLDGQPLATVNTFNYLGVTVDRHLTFGPHCKKLLGTVRSKYTQLRETRKCTDKETTLLLYKTMVLPCLEYCPIITDGGPAGLVKKLQTSQNDCLRICDRIFDARDANIAALHHDNKMDYLAPRRAKLLLSHMYKLSKDPGNLIKPVRNLRGNDSARLKVDRHKKDVFLKSPLHRGSRFWNRLKPAQQQMRTLKEFKTSLTPADLVPLPPLVV